MTTTNTISQEKQATVRTALDLDMERQQGIVDEFREKAANSQSICHVLTWDAEGAINAEQALRHLHVIRCIIDGPTENWLADLDRFAAQSMRRIMSGVGSRSTGTVSNMVIAAEYDSHRGAVRFAESLTRIIESD